MWCNAREDSPAREDSLAREDFPAREDSPAREDQSAQGRTVVSLPPAVRKHPHKFLFEMKGFLDLNGPQAFRE